MDLATIFGDAPPPRLVDPVADRPAAAPVAAPVADAPGWLSDRTAALLDRLFAAGCRPDAVPDGETFVADCPRCRQPRALAIYDSPGGFPVVRPNCRCDLTELLTGGDRAPQANWRWRRRLIGNGYPPIPPTIPDPRIIATPKIVCPCCQSGVVLPELRRMTNGRCYQCWLRN